MYAFRSVDDLEGLRLHFRHCNCFCSSYSIYEESSFPPRHSQFCK
uniref:Bm438 n=1 Tax=Brugia malayi TaxID=6279 RepID=A0A0J9XT67_BRUMA|nr:Bm438 [Brugia malayi]